MRELLIAAVTVLAFGALTTAPALADPPPGPPPGGGGGEEALTVNCPASIQDAVDQATAGTPLTITVNGTCFEEVVIAVDDVTIQGNGITDEVVGGITITGAHRVTIKSLTIRDGTTGVDVRRGAAVVLDDLDISGHSSSGILVGNNAYADILGSIVDNPAAGDDALALIDGGVVRVRDSTFLSANGDGENGAAVGLFRFSSARFDGANLIENTGGGNGLAIHIQHTSNLEFRTGASLVGDVIIRDNSAMTLKEINVTGDITVHRDSNLTIRAGVPFTVTGSVTIEDQSLLITDGPPDNLTITVGVTCTGGPAGGVVGSVTIFGGIGASGCTAF